MRGLVNFFRGRALASDSAIGGGEVETDGRYGAPGGVGDAVGGWGVCTSPSERFCYSANWIPKGDLEVYMRLGQNILETLGLWWRRRGDLRPLLQRPWNILVGLPTFPTAPYGHKKGSGRAMGSAEPSPPRFHHPTPDPYPGGRGTWSNSPLPPKVGESAAGWGVAVATIPAGCGLCESTLELLSTAICCIVAARDFGPAADLNLYGAAARGWSGGGGDLATSCGDPENPRRGRNGDGTALLPRELRPGRFAMWFGRRNRCTQRTDEKPVGGYIRKRRKKVGFKVFGNNRLAPTNSRIRGHRRLNCLRLTSPPPPGTRFSSIPSNG